MEDQASGNSQMNVRMSMIRLVNRLSCAGFAPATIWRARISKPTMRRAVAVILISSFFMSPLPGRSEDARIAINPAYYSNEIFRAYEDYYHPRVQRLRERYGLDRVVAGETDEFKRILLLRHWIHTTMAIDDAHPTPVKFDTFAILDAALKGGKFNCTHFSIVQQAVLNSYGYVTRRLGIGPGLPEEGFDGHHAVNEVWVNSLAKWVAVDAKYDLHFEKDGIPLSALEIRDEVWKNRGRDLTPAFGPERKPTDPRMNSPFWGRWATPIVYRWLSWETSTNRFTAYPAAPSSTLVMYDDPIFRENTWYRDGKPHWAYGTPYLLKIANRHWIYWTPNVISAKVDFTGKQVRIQLESFTPNFKTYQMRVGDGPWQDCDELLQMDVKESVQHYAFRAVNLFGVTGPPHVIEVQPQIWGFLRQLMK
jgi:hypothetical protein